MGSETEETASGDPAPPPPPSNDDDDDGGSSRKKAPASPKSSPAAASKKATAAAVHDDSNDFARPPIERPAEQDEEAKKKQAATAAASAAGDPGSPVKKSHRRKSFQAATWKSSGKKVSRGKVDLDLLVGCPAMKESGGGGLTLLGGGGGGGRHKWDVRILEVGKGVRLGVASASHQLSFTRDFGDDRIGEQRFTWACTNAGIARSRRHENYLFGEPLPFGKGSVVSFVLDLSSNSTGTLSMSVDGKELPATAMKHIFEDMKAPFQDPKKDVAFYPAASLEDGAAIELVGLK